MKITCWDSYKVAKDNIDGESTIFIYSNLKVSTMQFHLALIFITMFILVDMFSGLKRELEDLFEQVRAAKSPAKDGMLKMIPMKNSCFKIMK